MSDLATAARRDSYGLPFAIILMHALPVCKHLALISILASASCWHCCCCCYCPDFIHLLITTMDFWDHQTDFGDSWGFKFQSEQVALKSLK